MSELSWHVAGNLSELAEGKMMGVELGGRAIVLCRTKDGINALDNVCSHAYALMHEGRLRGNRLICPLHGASFDCRTGAVLGAPATSPLATFAVRVGVDGTIEVGLPN
ncbi:MAG: Rieske (2Fe-2S) protein [Gammaproteobacteria bacterium]